MANTIGQQIKHIRTKLQLNLMDFGNLLGTTPMTVWQWEIGTSLPDERDLIVLGTLAHGNGISSRAFLQRVGIEKELAQATVECEQA